MWNRFIVFVLFFSLLSVVVLESVAHGDFHRYSWRPVELATMGYEWFREGNMNKEQLRLELEKSGVRPYSYSLDGASDEAYCLDGNANSWSVYYY